MKAANIKALDTVAETLRHCNSVLYASDPEGEHPMVLSCEKKIKKSLQTLDRILKAAKEGRPV